MKSRDLQPRLLYPAKLASRIKGQIKPFLDKKKLKEFIITKPVVNVKEFIITKPLLHGMLKGLI